MKILISYLSGLEGNTPCASATAIGGTICYDIVGYSASKGIGVAQGVILYYSTELVGILLEKKMHNQLRIYKFYEWKQISRTSVNFQQEFMECNFW